MPVIISQNTTWAAGQTYNLNDTVQIAAGVTLTIEAGAIINGNGHRIQTFGTLDVRGSAFNPTSFNNTNFTFSADYLISGRININHAVLNGGSFLPPTGNASYGSFTVTNSSFSNMQEYSYIWYPTSDIIFSGNTFFNTRGFDVLTRGQVSFIDNTFINVRQPYNDGAAVSATAIYGPPLILQGNDFSQVGSGPVLSMSGAYSGTQVVANGNYWGVQTLAEIQARVLDRNDDLGRSGPATVTNFLISASLPQILAGGASSDTLSGSLGPDRLFGFGGNDVLAGGAGDDYIDGGTGGETPYQSIAGGPVSGGGDFADYRNATIGVQLDLGVTSAQATGFGTDTLVNVESAYGGNFDDRLTGNVQNNALVGGLGDDELFGSGGDDLLLGGSGNDRLNRGDGIDQLWGGSGDHVLVGGAGADLISIDGGRDDVDGGDGDDLIRVTFASSPALLQGGAGSDTLALIAATLTLDAFGAGNSIEFLSSVSSQISGNDGDNVLDFRAVAISPSGSPAVIYGGLGSDTVYGLSGLAADVIYGDRGQQTSSDGGADSISGGGGNDILSGDAGDDSLDGGEGNDELRGGGGSDSLNGAAGTDILIGGGGADTLTGGAGADTFRYLAASDSTAAASDTITDFVAGIDRIDLTALNPSSVSIARLAGGGTVVFAETPGGAFQTFVAGASLNGGDFVFNGGFGVFVIGSEVADLIQGTAVPDPLTGQGGDDVITGGAGADAIAGGAGRDVFRYVSRGDSNQQTGFDNLYDFTSGEDRIDLTLLNASSISILRTDNGSSFIYAETAAGVFLTTAANRTVQATEITFGSGPNGVGGFGIYLVGSGVNDVLIGTSLADPIAGGAGNDTITGGGGADAMFGDGGADTFVYLSASDSTAAASDGIFGFVSGTDRLDLRAVRTGAADTFGIAYLSGGSYLFVDLGGNGTSDLVIGLANTTLVASDILWNTGAIGEEPGVKDTGPEVLLVEDGDALFDGDLMSDLSPMTGRFMQDLQDVRGFHGQDWYL